MSNLRVPLWSLPQSSPTPAPRQEAGTTKEVEGAATAGTSPEVLSLRELLQDAAEELAAFYRDQYSDGAGGIHPVYQRKYDRDMELVKQLRARAQHSEQARPITSPSRTTGGEDV